MSHKKFTVGILAHVDAGKTTLTEALLYHTGTIRKQGRVDLGNTYLDFNQIERARGITVFSKQAEFTVNDTVITLIDTPGHVDLSTEMERCLQVLDAAILVISAVEGIQAHTETIWQLLKTYRIPVFVFINKCDREGADVSRVMEELKKTDSGTIELSLESYRENFALSETFLEEVATMNDELLERWFSANTTNEEWLSVVSRCVENRIAFPCIRGSALNGDGVELLLAALSHLLPPKEYQDIPLARVYKIIHDDNGQRLTLLKIIGGAFAAKDTVYYKGNEQGEKISLLLHLNGEKTQTILSAMAGDVCAATGITTAQPGEVLTNNPALLEEIPLGVIPQLRPVLEVEIILPEDVIELVAFPQMKRLEAEQPELNLRISPQSGHILAQVMGTIQMEVIAEQVTQRFGYTIGFGKPTILYKETISGSIIGYGHYEPLRHYAGAQIKIEEGVSGQGIVVEQDRRAGAIDIHYQKLGKTHIYEKEHKGVLVGAPLTDVTMTIVGGEMNKQDTKLGDFRWAVFRAIRQGLMKADSVLLEPWYELSISVPDELTGRVMSDIQYRHGNILSSESRGNGKTLIKAEAPVATFIDYPLTLASFAKGKGSVMMKPAGYKPCHNTDEVVEQMGYNPEQDLENTPNSIFFAKGAGYEVKWYDVDRLHHMRH